MKNILIVCIILTLVPPIYSQEIPIKENTNTKPYPYTNPVITHMYTADPAPHVMPDGRVWMVTSVDSEKGGGYATMHKYHSFSSEDMVNWIDHGEVFNLSCAYGNREEPENEDWALWAPDLIYRNGIYYLYYPIRIANEELATDQGDNGISYIAVATSKDPSKRFKVANRFIAKTEGIDPAIFIDDDDQTYLYWGDRMVAKLKDNMIELAEEPIKLDLNTDRFMEAMWMHKRNGKYYAVYHTLYDWRNRVTIQNVDDEDRAKSELGYSVSDNPKGPFKFMGTVNYEPGHGILNGPRHPQMNHVPWRLTLSNHGGIVEFHGQDYLFYHTSALSSWRQDEFKAEGTWTQRSVCIDKIKYEENGKIVPVKQTLESVPKVLIDQPYEIILNPISRNIKNGLLLESNVVELNSGFGSILFEDVNLGSGYYYFDLQIIESSNCKIELRLDDLDGKLIGAISMNEKSKNYNDGKLETFLRDANSLHNIYLIVKSNFPTKNIKISKPRFYAGSPSKI